MVLRYCRRHGRRWSVLQQGWVPFPPQRVQALEAYAARLRAIAPEAYALTLLDTSCDVCAATPWPLAQPYGATNGRDALTQLQAQAYDVIVCDLRMPELDGPAFYTLLTRQYPALCQRVIFLTGEAGSEASRTFLTQCGRPWLRKPSAITTIRRAIQQVLQAFPQA
jgi:CheY-like chemotaxis protein